MYFTQQALADLANSFEAINATHNALYEQYLTRTYLTERGKEFGQQGFTRRLGSLIRCIKNVYELIPPEREEAPDDDTRHDAELQVQAFVFHTFGAADNLAWIWVSEKNVTHNGAPLSKGSIGIRKEKVRASYTPAFRAYLDGLAPWFGYLESFRHALAHRIPLYIPPYIVTHANEVAYRDLGQRMQQASEQFNFALYEQLKAEQRALTAFRPWMQHSFIEQGQPMVFHVQMLADFNTIDEMAKKMLVSAGAKIPQ
jgi:hypothetical protein